MMAIFRRHIPAAFLVASAIVLMLGIYYWITESVYRIMILYSIFNVTLYWLTGPRHLGRSESDPATLGSLRRWFMVLAAALSALLILVTVGSLYIRPVGVAVALALVLILLTMTSLTNSTARQRSIFIHPWFLLAILAFAVLYLKFSIYVVQPNLMGGPAYTSVDAYRDYANAVRILKLSGIQPDKMIAERYYRSFPVVPLQIAIFALATGLPCNIGHLIIGASYEVLGVACAVLLAWAIVGRRLYRKPPAVVMMPVLVVLMQPILLEPMYTLTPLGLTVPLLFLAVYLCLSSMRRDPGLVRSLYLSILLITLVIIPMHPASIIIIIILFYAIAFFLRRSAVRIAAGVASIVIVCFAFYLTSLGGTGGPIQSIVSFTQDAYLAISEIMRAGPAFMSSLGSKSMEQSVPTDEMHSFLQAMPQALMLAIASVMVVRLGASKPMSAEENEVARQDPRWLYLFCGLLLALGIVVGYVLHPWTTWRVETRYFIFPLAPLALIGSTLVFVWILRNMNTAKRLMLVGLLSLYVVSAVTSPVFLHESSPLYARLIPTQSERDAAAFVSTSFEIDKTGTTQIVTDWPFYAHVRALMYSEHFYDNYLVVAGIMYEPMTTGHKTIMLSREYFINNAFLAAQSPYEKPLTQPEKWSHFNRIFDDSSTSVRLGDL